MAKNIGPVIGIDGEAKYRKEIETIIQQAKTLDAEMRTLASSFDAEADAQKKNKAVTEQTAKQIEVQKERIRLLEQMVQRSAKATGENSKTTLSWKEALANAKTELNNLESGLDNTTKKTSIFGETLKAALSKEAILGGINAIKDGMVEIGKAAMSFGKEVVNSYADFEQLEGGVNKLFGKDAVRVVENAQQAFKTAGLSANEYMETVTSFSASLISSLGDNTKEAANLADRAIRDMSDNANTFGTDMQSIQNAYQGFAKGQYNMLDNLKLGYGGTQAEMQRLIKDASQMTKVQKELGITVDESSLSFDNIVKAISVMQSKMLIAGTTASEASGTISGSISTLQGAFQNFVTGLGMNNADIDMLLGNLVEAFQNVVTNVQPIIQRLIDYIPDVIKNVIPVLQSMAPSLMATAVELFNSFLTALVSVLPDIIPVAVDAVLTFGKTIMANLPTILDAGISLIIALIEGLGDALPDLLEQAPMIIGNFVASIIRNLPRLAEAAVKIIQAIVTGLIQNIGGVAQAGQQVVMSIRDVFSGGIEAALGWGRDMITNFANGVASAASRVWENCKGVAQGVFRILHFSEPDEGPLKNFSTFAPDMMKTFATGIRKNTHLVTEAASQAAQGIAGAMSMTGGQNNAYNYGGFNIVVNQQPGQSSQAVVDELMVKIQNRIDQRKAVFAS